MCLIFLILISARGWPAASMMRERRDGSRVRSLSFCLGVRSPCREIAITQRSSDASEPTGGSSGWICDSSEKREGEEKSSEGPGGISPTGNRSRWSGAMEERQH